MKKIIAALLVSLAIGCAPVHHHDFQGQLLQINEQNEVIAVANRLFICTDNRDWQCVRDVFAPEVMFDMTSLTGGQPEKKTPQQIADGWDLGLKELKAIHHQAGNYQPAVRGNEADLFWQLQKHAGLVGRIYEVMVEGNSQRNSQELMGRTTQNKIINFPGPKDLLGKFVTARVTDFSANCLVGELVGHR